MQPDGLVELAERVEYALEFGDGSIGMLGEVFLAGLPESFDLALRGEFVGAPVVLSDAVDA